MDAGGDPPAAADPVAAVGTSEDTPGAATPAVRSAISGVARSEPEDGRGDWTGEEPSPPAFHMGKKSVPEVSVQLTPICVA